MGGTLSGGQQRLLSLAKVLVVPSKVLVADELSLGLAPVVVDAVYEGLREINGNGTALVVVEQQINRALQLANWAVVLEHGSVAYEGEPAGAGKAVEALMERREKAAASGALDSEESGTGPGGTSWSGQGPVRSDRGGNHMREPVIVDVVRTAFGKRGGALANWHPADLLGVLPHGAAGADRPRPRAGRRRHRRVREPGGRTEHQHRPQRLGLRRAAPDGYPPRRSTASAARPSRPSISPRPGWPRGTTTWSSPAGSRS